MSTMNISISIKVRPFDVPTSVAIEIPPRPRQDGIHVQQDTGLPLSSLDAETLEEMCEDFTNAVFAKAGKVRPPQDRPA